LGASDKVDVVNQVLPILALNAHDLEVVDDGLKHAICKGEIGDADLRIEANDSVEHAFLHELIHFRVVGAIGEHDERLACCGSLAGVEKAGHCASVGSPIITRQLQRLGHAGRDGGWSAVGICGRLLRRGEWSRSAGAHCGIKGVVSTGGNQHRQKAVNEVVFHNDSV
jgi:hypothetical protein